MSGEQVLVVDGVRLRVTVTRKRVKNINARLRGDRLLVSAPHHLPAKGVAEAVEALARRLVRRVRAREVNAEVDAAALARRVAARFPQPPRVARVEFVTSQTRRWGSYSPSTQTVRLNAALRALPSWVLEAVVAHELAHVVHRDHSAAFHALVDRVCPKSRRADAFLAGVSWIAGRWEALPPVERALLAGCGGAASDAGNDE